ncbi:unnamed protein product [Schistosoma spindalis]|nr:unnamed protein product [Schistosoma spindale]
MADNLNNPVNLYNNNKWRSSLYSQGLKTPFSGLIICQLNEPNKRGVIEIPLLVKLIHSPTRHFVSTITQN